MLHLNRKQTLGLFVWAAGLMSASCGDSELPCLRGDRCARRDSVCLNEWFFAETGDDQLTFLGGGYGTLSRGARSTSQGGFWNPDVEARAMARVNTDGFDATAELVWNDEVVVRRELERGFLQSGELSVLSYDDPDGSRVEFYVFGSEECVNGFPTGTLSRAEVEARIP